MYEGVLKGITERMARLRGQQHELETQIEDLELAKKGTPEGLPEGHAPCGNLEEINAELAKKSTFREGLHNEWLALKEKSFAIERIQEKVSGLAEIVGPPIEKSGVTLPTMSDNPSEIELYRISKELDELIAYWHGQIIILNEIMSEEPTA